MNLAIHITIVISAITLVAMTAIAVNYNPTPAHAKVCRVQAIVSIIDMTVKHA